jgi:hypothetical protein
MNEMERLTRKSEKDVFVVDEARIKHDENGYCGEAIDKLAKLEDMYDKLISKMKEITEEMESMRLDGRMHTPKFRALEASKISTNTMLILFQTYWGKE